MQQAPRRFSSWVWLSWAGLLVVLLGCGTSEYRRLMASRIDKVRTSAAFRALFGPSELPGTPIKIRVPMAFVNSYTEESAHSQDGEKISPDRLQPPFLPLPGLKLCYEGVANDNQFTKLPFYCYLAAQPAKPGDAEKLAVELRAQLKAKFNETPDAWEPVDATTPEGRALRWKKIRVVAEQPFRFLVAAKLETKNLPGIFELWLYDAHEYIVLVGWRSPSSIEGPAPPLPPAGTAAPPPVELKPDLATMPVLSAGTLTMEGVSLDAPAADAGP